MSPIPVSKSKIIPPSRRPQLLTRKRLLEFMYEALDKKLTLISAPAGYGKTSLLIDLIHDEDNDWKTCWLALDELDREPQRFASYFVASIQRQFPEFGKQSNNALDRMKSFDHDMERFLVALINELMESTSEICIIIIDDFHLVEDVKAIINFINRFVQLMPENCRLVISSRKIAEIPELPRLIAHGDASGIDFDDLAFQAEEIQKLIFQNEHRHISDEEAKRLVAETEGWITGLQFSNIKLPSSGNQSNLFNYFKQQVLDLQTPDIREFILRTSLFEEFDAKLCELVLQPLYAQKQDWQALIKSVASNNAFTLRVGESGNGLRYHHLFRDFIQEQFKSERPDEVAPLLSNLQLAYESLNEWEKAHHICKKINDTTALAEMVERAGSFMLQRANMILDSWLNELPVSMLKERPRLISIRGAIAYLKGDLQDSLTLLNQAVDMLQREEDTKELALALSRRGNTYRLLGDYEKSLSDIDQFISITEQDEELRSLYAEALRSKALILFRLGQAKKSINLFEKSLQLYESLNEKRKVPVLLLEIGMTYRAIADFEQARKTYEKALQMWKKEGDLFQQATLLNNLGVFYQFLGQYEESVFAFEKGLLFARNSKNVHVDVLISIGLGDVYAELEDFEMAKQNYQHAKEMIETIEDQFLQHALVFSQANAAFLQKDSAHAHQFIDSIKNAVLAGGSNYEIGLLYLICGRLSLLEKQFGKAIQGLQYAEKYFADGGRSVETNIVRIWLAAALYQNKNTDKAIETINSLTAPRGTLPHSFLVAAYQARNWLYGLQGKLTNNPMARELILGAEKFAKELPTVRRQVKRYASVIQPSAPKLKVQAFGHAMVLIDGKPSVWQTQSVRELFFYFLKTRKPLTKEQIGETLWPSKYAPAQLNLRFKNEIYRLRKATGQNTIRYENDLYRFNYDIDYEYDVEDFEAFIAKAKNAQDAQQKIIFYQKATNLVQGPYLNDVYSDWAIEERRRLEQIYLKALYELADLYLKDGQLENAINICEKAIQIDPSEEKAYEIAMKTYYKLGQRASIIHIYQRYTETMKKQYDLQPSKEMEDLYQKLTK